MNHISADRGEFGIYVHIPYCLRKCPYCDFNSYAAQTYPEDDYVAALLCEAAYYSRLPEWQERKCTSVYFGGGTPSLFSAAALERILSGMRERFLIVGTAEISIEANPATLNSDLSVNKLCAIHSSGFNRLNLGAQSFSPQKLERLGRIHGADDVLRSAEAVAAAGFCSLGVDLIFGAPAETIAEWTLDLSRALALKPAHLSVYGLTIEPGTDFARLHSAGRLRMPDDSAQAEMFSAALELLTAAGFRHYEISNYARPGFECRHNLGYWRRQPYLGLGAGAHSFSLLPAAAGSYGRRWSNVRNPDYYIQAAVHHGQTSDYSEAINKENAMLEFVFLGLRTAEGISFADYEAVFGEQMPERQRRALRHAADEGLIELDAAGAALTPRGFLFSDSVISSLI